MTQLAWRLCQSPAGNSSHLDVYECIQQLKDPTSVRSLVRSGMSQMAQALTIRASRFLLNDKPILFRGLVYQLAFRRSRTYVNPAHLPPRERWADRDILNDARIEDLKRDLVLFKELGINALWIYQVCIGASHDESMQLLQDNGIYIFICCSAPGAGECINRMAPHESYEPALLKRLYGVVDAFSKYDNVAGFVVADHIVNSPETTHAAEVVKAVIRDVKAYLAHTAQLHGRRAAPVGLADDSWAATQTPSLEYYTAGSYPDMADFYAAVDMVHSIDRKHESSAWSAIAQPERFSAAKVPVFISEYGSNVDIPRQFKDASALYDEERTRVFSGGFAYEFFEAANRYGIVKEGDDGLTKLVDYENLLRGLRETRGVEGRLQPVREQLEHTGEQLYTATSDLWKATAQLPGPCPLLAEEYLQQEGL